MPSVRRGISHLLDTLLPQDCALCGMPADGDSLCRGCVDDLPRHGPAVCPRCGDIGNGAEPCGRCLRHPPHFDACRAAFCYAFPVDRLIQRLKYGGRLHLSRWWAGQLEAVLTTVAAGHRVDLIGAMPLHSSRLAERGFNQAIEIGRRLAATSSIAMPADLFQRIRATPSQAAMDREQRLKNVRGAFECRRDLSGLHVLLLDDVMTTGASLGELARVAKAHGAVRVTACVGARALSGPAG